MVVKTSEKVLYQDGYISKKKMSLGLTGLRTWRAGVPREYEPGLGLGAGDCSPPSGYVQPGGASPGRVTGGHAGCKGSSSAVSS